MFKTVKQNLTLRQIQEAVSGGDFAGGGDSGGGDGCGIGCMVGYGGCGGSDCGFVAMKMGSGCRDGFYGMD